MNILSLFDGISGAQVALNRAGIKYDKYFASEIDKYAIQITQKNFPNTIQLGDITKLDTKILPTIKLLIGGSPCQSFSSVGKGLNFEDPRGKLFFEYIRILKEVKPKYFLLENVKMKKEWEDIITENIGVKPILINSSLVSAQSRNRMYWTNIPVNGMPEDKNILLKDILLKENIESLKLSDKEIAYMDRSVKGGRTHWDFQHHHDSKNPKSQTLVANLYKGVPYNVLIDGDIKRKLHPIECERLQTYPDKFTEEISNTQRYKSLGNSFTVDVITHILHFMS